MKPLQILHFLGLKRRHILTRSGFPRIRVFSLVILGIVLILGFYSPSQDTHAKNNSLSVIPGFKNVTHIDEGGVQATSPILQALSKITSKDKENASEQPKSDPNIDPATLRTSHTPIIKPNQRRFTMQSGDTLSVLFERASIDNSQSYQIIESLKAKMDPRDLKAGQKIDIEYTKQDNGDVQVKSLNFPVSQLEKISVSKSDAGYRAQKHIKTYSMSKRAAEAEINEDASSLYLALARKGVPHDVIANTIRAYSWDIDFQRDIWQGNTIRVYYEEAVDEDGQIVNGKNKLIFAHLVTRLKDLPIYRFQENGKNWSDFFHADGRSVRALLMSTPVDGARLSSGFGHRKHPVLGYTKLHKGVDFAAPTGTPIYAAGDGIVERASRFSSYGHYIRIRHKGSLKTAYAHLHGYARGIKAGVKVKQGQVIGFIGTTGRSTGPHLHYEVIQNGVHINPRSLKLPTGDQLKGAELERFKAEALEIDRGYEALTKRRGRIAENRF